MHLRGGAGLRQPLPPLPAAFPLAYHPITSTGRYRLPQITEPPDNCYLILHLVLGTQSFVSRQHVSPLSTSTTAVAHASNPPRLCRSLLTRVQRRRRQFVCVQMRSRLAQLPNVVELPCMRRLIERRVSFPVAQVDRRALR